jgi:hypothetical protein
MVFLGLHFGLRKTLQATSLSQNFALFSLIRASALLGAPKPDFGPASMLWSRGLTDVLCFLVVSRRVDQIATTEHCGSRVSLKGLTLPRAQALLLVLLCAWLPGAVTSILLGNRPATVKAFQLSCRPVRRFVGQYGYQKVGAHTFGSHFVSRERSFASRTLIYGAGSTLRDG